MMRIFFPAGLFILLCSILPVAAQSNKSFSIEAGYSNTRMNNNAFAVLHYSPIQNWDVYAGVKYLLNSPWEPKSGEGFPQLPRPEGNKDYTKSLYAENFRQHFSVKAGVNRYFSIRSFPDTKVYGFYDFQYAKAIIGFGTFYDVYDEYMAAYGKDTVTLYREGMLKHGPLVVYEHHVGIGLRSKLANNLYYKAFLGVGFVDFNTERYDPTPGHAYDYNIVTNETNWSKIFGISLEYTFSKSEKKKKKISASSSKVAKDKIVLGYNDAHAGVSFNMVYNRHIQQNWGIYGGLKYHVNTSPRNASFKRSTSYKNMYAQNFMNHIGIKLGAERYFNLGNGTNTQLFSFADVQVMKGRVRQTNPVTFDDPKLGKLHTFENFFTEEHGPATLLESYVGIGLRTQVTNNVSMRFFGGTGPVYFSAPAYSAETNTTMLDNKQLQLGKMFGLAVEYSLN